MKNIEEVQKDVKNILSEKRYNHSVGVMERAKELAEIYGLDIKKAALVGIAHDVAKELSNEEMLKYAKENNIRINETEKTQIYLLHGKIGADICKKRYGFTEDMINAIKYHTTGNVNMNKFDKIIFLADKTEKNRTYLELEKIVKLSNSNINDALLFFFDYIINYNIEKKRMINIDTILVRNKILNEKNIK